MINSTQSEFEDEVPSDGLDNNVTFALRNLLPLYNNNDDNNPIDKQYITY